MCYRIFNEWNVLSKLDNELKENNKIFSVFVENVISFDIMNTI